MKSEGGYTVHDPEQCLPSELTGDRIPAADADPDSASLKNILKAIEEEFTPLLL